MIRRRAIGAFFAKHDIWLTPTTAQTSPRLGYYNMNIDLPPAEFITSTTQRYADVDEATIVRVYELAHPRAKWSGGWQR